MGKKFKMQSRHFARVTACRNSGCQYMSKCREKWGNECKLLQGRKIPRGLRPIHYAV